MYIYDSIKKKYPPMITQSEGQAFMAEFGIAVFNKYLLPFKQVENELNIIKNDLPILLNFCDKKKMAKLLSKEMLKKYNIK